MTQPAPYPSLVDFAATFAERDAAEVPAWVHDPGLSILPGLDTLGLRSRVEDILDTAVALQRSEWLQEGVYVGPRAMGDVYRDVLEAARVLQIAVPPALISSRGAATQGAFGTDARAYLHLSSFFMAAAGPGERLFVTGRLCGHIAARQVTLSTLYAVLADSQGLRKVARQGLGPTLEFVLAPLSVGVRLTLSRWHRAAELSADRAGLLVCGDLDSARMALLRQALGIEPDLSPEEYLDQNRTSRESGSPGRWAEVLSSRPWMHKRMRGLEIFARSQLWTEAGHDAPDGESLELAELERQTTSLLGVG